MMMMMMEKDNYQGKNLRLEEIIKLNSVQFSRCLLTCRLNSVSAIIKAAQEHKYNTQTTQIHKNGTPKYNKNKKYVDIKMMIILIKLRVVNKFG
jgi:hypothetical protein